MHKIKDEYDYICDVLNLDMTHVQMLDFYNKMSIESVNLARKFISTFPEDIMVSFIILAICVCSADGEISHEEHRVLKKYF